MVSQIILQREERGTAGRARAQSGKERRRTPEARLQQVNLLPRPSCQYHMRPTPRGEIALRSQASQAAYGGKNERRRAG